MKNSNKRGVYNAIITSGLVPLFYCDNKEKTIRVVKAIYKGGCRILEFTNRGDKAPEVFADITKIKSSYFPDMLIGIGSVIDSDTAVQYIEKDADFIVGPNLDEGIADLCNKKNIAYIPGAATPNEIIKASRSGSEIVKIFPASTMGGPDFIKAVLGPMPWLKLMPTGGVTTEEENIRKWFKAGVVCVGIGSELINKRLIEEGDYGKLTVSVSEVLKIIKDIRNEY